MAYPSFQETKPLLSKQVFAASSSDLVETRKDKEIHIHLSFSLEPKDVQNMYPPSSTYSFFNTYHACFGCIHLRLHRQKSVISFFFPLFFYYISE